MKIHQETILLPVTLCILGSLSLCLPQTAAWSQSAEAPITVITETASEGENQHQIFESAISKGKAGYLVLAIYQLQMIIPDSEVYAQAQLESNRLKAHLKKMNISYEAALKKYSDEYQEALALYQQKFYEQALEKLSAITEGSPFYIQTQEQMQKIQQERQEQPIEVPETAQTNETQPDASVLKDETRSKQLSARLVELALQGKLAWSGEANLSPGAGLGVTYFPLPFLGIHTEAAFFASEHFFMGHLPLSVRYYFNQGHWIPYAGLGGFLSLIHDDTKNLQLPLGALLELGIDYRFNSQWAWSFEFNYGLTFTPALSHTLGANTGIKFAF